MIKVLFLFNRKNDLNLLKKKLKELGLEHNSSGQLLPTFSLDIGDLKDVSNFIVIDPKYKEKKVEIDLESFNRLKFKYFWLSEVDKKILNLTE